MPVDAVIVTTRSPDRQVAGLSVLERNILAAASVGLRRLTVIGDRPAAVLAPTLKRVTASHADVALQLYDWTSSQGQRMPGLAGETSVLLHTDGVISPDRVQAMLDEDAAADGCLRSPTVPGDRDLWRLPTRRLQEALARLAPNRPCRAAALYDRLARALGQDAVTATPQEGAHYDSLPGDGAVAGVEKALFRRLAKPSDGYASRLFNRPLSTWLSRHLSRYPITPAQLTGVTALFGLAMFAAFLGGGGHSLILGAVLFQAASVVDGLDGEIARAKFLASPRGAAWDTAVDMITNLLFIVGLMSNLYLQYGERYLYLGFYLFGLSAVAIIALTLLLRLGPGGGSFDVLGRAVVQRLVPWPRLQAGIAMAEKFFKRDSYALLFAVMALAGLATAIPWLLAIGVTLWLLAVIVNAPYILNARPEAILPAHIKTLRP